MAYISPQTGGLSFQEDNIPLQNKKAKDPTASLCSKPPKSQQKAQELLEEESKTLPSPSLSPDSLINLNFNPVPCTLSFQERLKLCLSVGEEIVTEPRLSELLKLKKQFICYDGFEPSGRMHIAQGIYKVINVNRLTKAGGLFIFWIADYFAMLNHKLGGDLEKIKIVGKYFIEIWKAAGMDLRNVKFLWASEEINKNPEPYWRLVMDIAMRNTLNRIINQIMGREETDELAASQIFYPCMQCADIFTLKADICQLGTDQRKVNMLAIEYCDQIGRKEKPVILSHHMLSGLKEGQSKMSKSDPFSAIFVEDTSNDVKKKINRAYCPPGIVEENPVLDYFETIICNSFEEIFIERTEENGGNIVYTNYQSLKEDYASNKLHPGDLKNAAIVYLNKLLEPIRQHFINDPEAKQLLAKVKEYRKS